MARGKYADVIDKLPKLLGTEPTYQAKVNFVKELIEQETGFQRYASALALRYNVVRAEKEELEEQLSQINLRLEAISQLMINQYEVEATSRIVLTDGYSISTQPEPHAVVEDKEVFRVWCIDMGLGNELMLPWPKTNSITKERLLNGDPEPAGVRAYTRTKIVRRK